MTDTSLPFTINLGAPTIDGLGQIIQRAALGFSDAVIHQLGISTKSDTTKVAAPVSTNPPASVESAAPVVANPPPSEPSEAPDAPHLSDDAPAAGDTAAVTEQKRKRRTKAEMEAARLADAAALLGTTQPIASLVEPTPVAEAPAPVAEAVPVVDDLFGDAPATLVEPYPVLDLDGNTDQMCPTPEAWVAVMKGLLDEAPTVAILKDLATYNTKSGVLPRLVAEGREADIVAPFKAYATQRLAALNAAAASPASAPAAGAPITDDQIRETVQNLAGAKGGDVAMALLQSFGVKRASEVPADKRFEFTAQANLKAAS